VKDSRETRQAMIFIFKVTCL